MALKGQKTKSDFLEWEKTQLLIQKLERDSENLFALLIAIGSYTGLRISDIQKLRWNQILNKDQLELSEQKTGKLRRIQIHADLQEIAARIYSAEKPKLTEYLFLNRTGEVISVQYINRKLKQIEKQYELGIRFSTHSFRKTFGRRIWNRNNNSEKALFMLGQVFNHSSIQTTKIYLGISEQEIANVYLSL